MNTVKANSNVKAIATVKANANADDIEFDFAMCHGSYNDNVFNEDKQPYCYCLL